MYVQIKHIHYAFWIYGLYRANSFAGYYRAVELKPFAQFPSGRRRVIREWENHSWVFYIRRSFPRSSASPLMDRNIPAANSKRDSRIAFSECCEEFFVGIAPLNRPRHLAMSWCVFDRSLNFLHNRGESFVVQMY